MRIIGLSLVVVAVLVGCKKEPPATESANKSTPVPAAAEPASADEPAVDVDVDDEALDDGRDQGEPMDEVDEPSHDLGDKAGAADLPDPPGERNEPQEGTGEE